MRKGNVRTVIGTLIQLLTTILVRTLSIYNTNRYNTLRISDKGGWYKEKKTIEILH